MATLTNAPIITPDAPRVAKRMRSVEATRAALECQALVTTRERLLMVALAGFSDDNFECFPGVPRLAKECRNKGKAMSERHVRRLTHSLRRKGVIHFDDNRGGFRDGGDRKSNVYRLVFASHPDKFRLPDISHHPDNSSRTTLTDSRTTLTNSGGHPDIAMSPEGVEWFEGQEEWAEHWDSDVTVIRHFEDAVEELDLENETEDGFLSRIRLGERLCRTENCSLHGDFVRQGFRCGKWIAWEGVECIYSPGFGYNAGCHGCEEKPGSGTGDCNPNLPIRGAELRSPVFCPTHGSYILTYRLYERPQSWVDLGEDRFDISGDHNSDCPGCDADWMYETNLKHQLELSTEQWERGRDRIIAAIDYAQEVD